MGHFFYSLILVSAPKWHILSAVITSRPGMICSCDSGLLQFKVLLFDSIVYFGFLSSVEKLYIT